MLNARNAILLAVLTAIAATAGIVLDMAAAPDGGGLRPDSFGIRADGQRAAFELLAELGVPTQRGLVPPTAFLQSGTRIVFLNPDPEMVSLEPQHIRDVEAWVRGGGHVLIALSPHRRTRHPVQPAFGETTTFLKEFGLEAVTLTELDDLDPDALKARNAGSASEETAASPASAEEDLAVWFKTRRSTETVVVNAAGRGEWSAWETQLTLPKQKLQVISARFGPAPASQLELTMKLASPAALAAVFPHGQGQVTLVSDVRLFDNSVLAATDNAPVAARLLAADAERVVWDEFYHGVTVRGQPAWLLTRQPYGLLVLLLLASAGVWAWRGGLGLGPSLPEKLPSRRTVSEYVCAMADLFCRAKARRHTIAELRLGVLRQTRQNLGITRQSAGEGELAERLAQRDPAFARQFNHAMVLAARILESVRPSEASALAAGRELAACLKPLPGPQYGGAKTANRLHSNKGGGKQPFEKT